MIQIKGTSASPGKALGRAHLLARLSLIVERGIVDNPQMEILKLESALDQAETDLRSIIQTAMEGAASKEVGIFEAQIMILHDPDLLQRTTDRVKLEKVNIAYAWQEAIRFYADRLRSLDNEYLAARVVDVEDVGRRVLSQLLNQSDEQVVQATPAIIVADDLTPADTISMDRRLILAFCTRKGGPTSHAAILSKALGIPCVVALGDAILQIKQGQLLLVDGQLGGVTVDPDLDTINRYKLEAVEVLSRNQEAENLASLPASTRDHHQIEIVANVGSKQDAADAIHFGAEGIGLLRTEFLFIDRIDAPSREEQIAEYTQIFKLIGKSRPILVRTLDIGGDKPVRYLPVPTENNPFLGIRGIRLSLRHPDLFGDQLSALLIAGFGYDLRIMFPMVSTIEEILQARELTENCLARLGVEGIPHTENYQLGIMVEVPSAAILASKFAEQVDFFSIGTNDLTQYTMAAERTGGEVASLNDPFHPAVLTLIHQVVKAAHEQRKWVGICGELAGDTLATPLLIGMGLDELSASPRLIPQLKQKIRTLDSQECKSIAEKALRLSTSSEVRELLNETVLK